TPTPAESQNWVRVRSTTNVSWPRAAASSSTARRQSALLASISSGAATTGTPLTISMGYLTPAICAPTSGPDAYDSAAIPGVWMELGPGGPAQNDEPAVPSPAGRIVPSPRQ